MERSHSTYVEVHCWNRRGEISSAFETGNPAGQRLQKLQQAVPSSKNLLQGLLCSAERVARCIPRWWFHLFFHLFDIRRRKAYRSSRQVRWCGGRTFRFLQTWEGRT